jgi:hypothetical protein
MFLELDIKGEVGHSSKTKSEKANRELENEYRITNKD